MASFNVLDYYFNSEPKEGPAKPLMAKTERKPSIDTSPDPYRGIGTRMANALRSAFDTEEEFLNTYSKRTSETVPDASASITRLQAIMDESGDGITNAPVNEFYNASYEETPEPLETPDYGMVGDIGITAQEAAELSKPNTALVGLMNKGFSKEASKEEEPTTHPRLRPGSDSVLETTLDTIMESEGGFQRSSDDSGNYVNGKLIGTNRGVTPAALAKARGVDPKTITVEDMKNITDREARNIFISEYYYKPKIDRLPPEIQDTVFDMQINAGNNAIKILQRMVGVEADGVLGEDTINAVKKAGITRNAYSDARMAYYRDLAKRKPEKRKFLDGWLSRAAKYKD